MPDILDQDYQQPIQASDIPKVEPVVSAEPPVVDVQAPVVDKYNGPTLSAEEYSDYLDVRSQYSKEDQSKLERMHDHHEWDANDFRYTLKKKNLAPEQRIQYQTELNKRESMEHISELFLDPSKLVRDLPKHMQDSFAIGYDHSEGPSEDMMKQINQIYLSNVLGKPLNEVAKDWDAIKASFYTYKGEKDLTFDVTSEQAAFNWNKDTLHPDTLSSTEAIGVGMSKIRSNWNADDEQKALDELSYNESLLAITNPELVNIDKILEAESNISNTPRMSNDGDNWLTGAWYSAVTMGSRFGSSWYESKEEAFIGAGVGATTALIAGQLGPQAATPEEIVTVPAGAAIGFTKGFGIGQFNFWRKQGTGAIFREAVKKGVNVETASGWAQVGGVLYAAAEKIGGLNKMPLVDKVLKAKAVKIYRTRGITETAAAIGKHVSIQTLKEIGEEGLQKGIQTATVETALYDDGKISDEEYIEALLLKVPEDSILEMYNVVKDGGIFFFGALSTSSINLEKRALTPAEQAKEDAKYKGMVKSHRKEVDERVSESSKDTSKKEGEVDNAVNDKLSQSLLRYMDENLSAQESQDLNRKLVETMGLLDSSNMTKEQLMAESEMDEKSSETSMRKKIIANRAKFILPTAATANFQNFVSAVVPENIAVTHESASIEFGEQIELIQQKVEANIKLTDKEQGMLDIHEEKYVEDIGYGEGLVESVLELETDTVVEASVQRGIDVGTLTEAEVEQWIADKKADPQAMKLARYIAQNSDAKILFTGKEFTYQNAIDEGLITEEQARRKLIESGKMSEGADPHDIALNKALIAGYNENNVVYISSLGDVTTVIEEVSEVYVKSRMKSDSDFVKELESFYNEYAKANPEFNKDTSMVEFFSDRAIEYTMGTDVGFDGASDTMISILDSIKALFDLIVQRALTLNRMIGEGKVSKEMQTALREAGMPLFKTDKDVKAKSKEDVRQKKVSEVSNVNIEEAEFSETEDELLDDYLAFLDEEENQHLKKVEIAEVDFQTEIPDFQTIFSKSDEIESTERAKLISDAKLTRSIQLTEDLANVEGDNTKSLKILSDFAQKWLKHDDNFGSYDGVLGRFEQNYTKTQSIPQSLAKTKEAILSRIATKERKEAQARISKKLNKALNETKKAKGRAVIRQDAKGNDKEILVSPEYFEELEKIKAIREMTQEAVDLALQNAIDESDIEQVHRIERWKTQKQDAGASFIAEQILDDMMEAGKVDYMKTISTDKKFDEAFKQLALNEITGGKDRLKTQVEAKNLDMTKEQRDKYDSIENPQKKARYLSSLMKAKKLNWYKKINLEAQTLSSLMDMISQDPSKGMMEGELVNWIELLTQNADDKKDVVIEDMHDQLKDGLKRFLSETEEGLNTLSEQQLDTGIIIRDVEAQISYLDAITLLMYSENEHSKAALKNTGIGAIELKQIEDFVNRYAENHLDEEKKNNVKEFIKWTFDLTSANNASVNEMHKKLYGVPMTFEENYLPLVIKYSSEMDKPENRSTNVVSAWHSIKTDRVNHEREIDLEGINLLHVLTNHIEDTANFLAKAQAGAQLRKVLTDVDIQAAIAQEFGQEFNTTIKNRITSWEIGEQRRNNNLGSLDKLLRNYTRARIWGKTGNFVKQLTSAMAYTIEMPFDEWAKRSFVADVSEYKTRFDTLKRLSPFLRERLNKGAGSALRTALETNSLYNVLEGESVENKIVRMGMIFTQFGDIGAIVLGGWAVFEYKKEQYLAEGKSPQAAENAAILDFERFTARTQQSGKAKDISNIQENTSPLIKLFVMFQNSQFAYWRTINAAVRALQSGKADKKKAAKALLITGLILPLAFGTATIGNKALWMALTGFGINDDEEELLKRMALGLLMSPVSGLPSVLGSTAAATVAAFTPLEAPFAGVTPIIDDIASWSRAPASIKTAADILGVVSGLNFKEVTSVGQDIYKGIKE